MVLGAKEEMEQSKGDWFFVSNKIFSWGINREGRNNRKIKIGLISGIHESARWKRLVDEDFWGG